MISTHWRKPQVPPVDDFARLDVLARQAADLLERARAEATIRDSAERQAFLLGLSDALRPLRDPLAVQAAACRLLGEHLGADHVCYFETDAAAGLVRVRPGTDYTRDGSPSLVGEYGLADCGRAIPAVRAGPPLVIADTGRSELVPDADRPALADARIAAHMSAPLVKDGEVVGALFVIERVPREWTPAEVSLVQDVADRTWAVVQRARAVEALADELAIMTRLHDLADRLLSVTDLQAALGDVLDAAIALFAADRGTLQIHDPEAAVLRYGASRGFDQQLLSAVPPIDRDFHSKCAAAIRTGERVIAADLLSDPRWADHASTAASLGYKAAVSFPMRTRRENLQGVRTVHFREPHAPTDRELRWADPYARLGAHLVERGRAEAALRQSEERYRALFGSMDET